MDKSEDRKLYLEIGICPTCKKRPVEPGKKSCYECLARERDRYREKRKNGIYNQSKDTERKRRLTEERRRKGLCYRCGKYETPNGSLCGTCKAKAKQYRTKYRKDIERSERPSYGRCYICGKEELYKDTKVCKNCYETRLDTLPAMWESQTNEYFDRLNRLVFLKKERALEND